MVVETGLSAQLEKDWYINTPAPMKPETTIHSQSSLTCRLLVEM